MNTSEVSILWLMGLHKLESDLAAFCNQIQVRLPEGEYVTGGYILEDGSMSVLITSVEGEARLLPFGNTGVTFAS